MCKGEKGNTWTHLIGAVFALTSMWVIWPAVNSGWQMTMGVIFFIVGMFLMFLSSTIYHWLRPGKVKQVTETISNAINRKAYLYFRLINIYTRFFFFVILFVSEPS